jgi:hypothetical protein
MTGTSSERSFCCVSSTPSNVPSHRDPLPYGGSVESNGSVIDQCGDLGQRFTVSFDTNMMAFDGMGVELLFGWCIDQGGNDSTLTQDGERALACFATDRIELGELQKPDRRDFVIVEQCIDSIGTVIGFGWTM